MKTLLIPNTTTPIRTIFCIGRNYVEHAKELGNEVPESPIVFLKPQNSICFNNSKVNIPSISNDIHHEVEIILAIGKSGKNIPEDKAFDYLSGFGIGIDFTARDLQQKAKEKGHPWTIAKGFDNFAPISAFSPISTVKNISEMSFSLSVNKILKQNGNTRDMIHSIPALVAYLSSIFTLSEGDLIFTGTPSGVSAIKSGDILEAEIAENGTKLSVQIS